MAYGATQTQLVQTLHNLALSIQAAKRAGNAAAVQGLWNQFQAVAEEYRATGASEAAILALINRTHDAVLASVQELAETGGKAAAGALGLKSLWPLALVALGLYLLPHLATGLRPRRA